jgi:glycosyltransferase involved in cell wall biosynthesis
MIYGDINTVSGGYLYDRKLVSYFEAQDDHVEVINIGQIKYWKQIFNNIDPDKLNKLELDVLIQDEMIHPAVFRINHQLKEILNCPIVSLVHLLNSSIPRPFYKRFLYQAIEKRYLLSVDGLILNSRFTLEQSHKILDDRLPPFVMAVPAGNNFSSDESSIDGIIEKTRDNKLKLLYVGSITHQKGLMVLLKALNDAIDQNIILTVSGREDLEPDYVRKVKDFTEFHGLEGRVRFTGSLSHTQLEETYRTHDVLVLPSVNESYGIVYLEAQQFGLPVIGTGAGGAGEIIHHGKNGYLIRPGDYHRLAELIQMLHNNHELLNILSLNAQYFYQKHPTWENTGENIREFLLEIMARKGSNGGR